MPTPGRRGRALVLWAGLAFRTQGCRHTTPSDINLDNEITNQVTALFFFFFFFSSFVAPLDINLDNEITNHRMTELFCANPREVREDTSAVGQVSSSNSRLPSQLLTAPTPSDINLDNEITNQITTLFFFFFFFLFFFCSSIGHQFGQ